MPFKIALNAGSNLAQSGIESDFGRRPRKTTSKKTTAEIKYINRR